jgi:hypothetical protein
MFAKLDNGSALCLADYGDIKAGAIVPPSNELWSQVKECNTWGDVPIEYTRDYIQTERLKNSIRSERDTLLKDTDWIVAKSLEQGAPVPDQWKAYRQALRDITEQAGFPENIEWPEKPV